RGWFRAGNGGGGGGRVHGGGGGVGGAAEPGVGAGGGVLVVVQQPLHRPVARVGRVGRGGQGVGVLADQVVHAVPPVGRLLQQVVVVQLSQVLGRLVEAGTREGGGGARRAVVPPVPAP